MTQQEERLIEAPQAGVAAAAAEGRRRLEDFTEARDEIWDRLQDANRVWVERMQQEAALTAELASKLTASRSFSDTATALQDWTSKHVEMTTEDTRRLFADAQQMFKLGACFWSNSAQIPSPETAPRFAS
ncbi:MAG: hypothetical protein FJX48_04415 [Alphaproteobacteria bacterium]|nr:hypothetical protein [Alphaproteobacteria bacterium]